MDRLVIGAKPYCTRRRRDGFASRGDAISAALERLRRSRDASLKDLINEALRRGLKDMSNRTKRRERLRTRSVALGQLRIADVDNIGEGLAAAEGEAHK